MTEVKGLTLKSSRKSDKQSSQSGMSVPVDDGTLTASADDDFETRVRIENFGLYLSTRAVCCVVALFGLLAAHRNRERVVQLKGSYQWWSSVVEDEMQWSPTK